jgi:hypothetical protein
MALTGRVSPRRGLRIGKPKKGKAIKMPNKKEQYCLSNSALMRNISQF